MKTPIIAFLFGAMLCSFSAVLMAGSATAAVASQNLDDSVLLVSNIPSICKDAIFSVRYGSNAQEKKYPSLKEATLLIQVYKNGSPQGFQTVKTGQNQSFALRSDFGANLDPTMVVEVVSLHLDSGNGQLKKFMCRGSSALKKNDIKIYCL